MFRRRKTVGDRFRDVLSALILMAVGVSAVAAGMNILVVVAPVLIGASPSPSPTPDVFPVLPSYPIVTDPPDASAIPIASLPATKPVLKTKQIDEHGGDAVWDLRIVEPQFEVGSTPLADDMNQMIDDFWRGLADQFENGSAAVRTVYGKTNHFVGTYTNDLLTPELASFAFTWTNDSGDGDSIGIATFTFDLRTGQPLVFDDLFTDPQAALQALSRQSGDLLYYQLGASWSETAAVLGTTPNHGNFSNWEVTKDGLRIIFNQFQVSPIPKLTPAVVVPWSALTALMTPRGPVAVLSGAIPAPTPEPTVTPIPSATETIQVKS